MRTFFGLISLVAIGCGDISKGDDTGFGAGDGAAGDGGDVVAGSSDGGSSDGGSSDGDGSDGDGSDGDGGDSDSDSDSDSEDSDGDVTNGSLPDVPSKSGAVYVGDFIDSKLRWYDITGDTPMVGGNMDLGSSIHDLAVDSVNHRLAAAIDGLKKVVLLSLDDPADGLDAPTIVSEVELDNPPWLVQIDPYNDRLYVHTAITGAGQVTIVDISTLASPSIIATIDTPIFGSWSVDPIRRIIFLFNGVDETLEVYDVANDSMDMLVGAPIDLRADYPEENSWGFQAFNVTADPWSARVFAGRTQGNLSELIAYEYDDFIPGEGSTYSDGASAETMVSLPDAIDLTVDLSERHVPLLFSHNPLPDSLTGEVVLVGAVYDGGYTNGGMVTLTPDLGPSGTCADEDGPYCFYRYWSDSTARWSLPTDGAACIDAGRRIAVGGAITVEGEGQSHMQFFRYSEDGDLSAWISADGGTLNNGPMATSVVCH